MDTVAPRLDDQRQARTEIGQRALHAADAFTRARELGKTPLDPRSQFRNGRRRGTFRRSRGEHHLDAVLRIDADAHAAGPGRAANAVGDRLSSHLGWTLPASGDDGRVAIILGE
jgi:hypothetical protein